MSASDAMETGVLNLFFKNQNFANIGDSTGLQGSSTAGSFYISLHTSDPGDAGNQTTNEANYTSYARVAVVRSGSGWTVSGGSATNAAGVVFATCTGGTNTITHFGIGTASSGSGTLLFSGALTSSLVVSTNITPLFAPSGLTVTVD